MAESGTWEVPLSCVVIVTLPPARPPTVGVNVTGTVSEEPEPRSAGRLGLGVPRLNLPLDTDRPVMVMLLLAVTVNVSVEEWPTTVAGKVGEAAVIGAETGAPNPIT